MSSAGSPVRVWLDDGAIPAEDKPMIMASQLANMKGIPQETVINGRSIAASPLYSAYVVKKGLLRILNVNSTQTGLFKGHQGQEVLDVQSLGGSNGVSVFGTVARATDKDKHSSLFVWQVWDGPNGEAQLKTLLEIRSNDNELLRCKWNAGNINVRTFTTVKNRSRGELLQKVIAVLLLAFTHICLAMLSHHTIRQNFWLIHKAAQGTVMATLVDSGRIDAPALSTDPHVVYEFGSKTCFKKETAQIKGTPADVAKRSLTSNLLDLAWATNNPDEKRVLSTHDDGSIVLWNYAQGRLGPEGYLKPTTLFCFRIPLLWILAHPEK